MWDMEGFWMSNRVFFLGGCDLEMCVIKRLLEKAGEEYVDKKLKWGAKTSDIKDEFEKYKFYDEIYLVEFEDDVGLLKYKNVFLIDHHNENSSKPSSIEQIASILNHTLNRFEIAVALNDKGYIKALRDACYNEYDIKRIRQLDRKCQGVSIEEEAAKKIKIRDIVYFPYQHFSPLVDRFYLSGKEQFVIYNDYLTMFYGFEIEKLKKIFKDKKFFYGGGNKGYFGVEERLSEKEIKQAFKEDKKKEISAHIFILPFFIKKEDDEEKTKEKFIKFLIKNGFEKKEFEVDKPKNFNEFVYFHSYTKDVLFKSDYLELKIPENSKYLIRLNNGNEYELDIEDIAVRIFENNIGLLSFHLKNYNYLDPEDILKINDFGRRIFPQYIGETDILDAKNTILPASIGLILGDKKIIENFCKFKQNYDVKNNPKLFIPKFVSELIGDELELILDDRMFVVSFYLAPNWLLNKLKKFEKNDWWYRYVFVDGNSKTCQDDEFCEKIIKKATYSRWRNYGVLWGITRYSLVGVGDWDLMITHAKTMYFQMASLVLLYRSMILNLSYQVKKLIDYLKEEKDISEIRQNTKKLYQDYLEFLNGIFFKEVTAQEQGIEMYKMLLEASDINSLLQSFDREMEELDNFIDILEEKERNENLELLSILGALFLPASLIVGILGISYKDIKIDGDTLLVSLIFSLMVGVLFVGKRFFKLLKNNKSFLVGMVVLMFFIFIIGNLINLF
jgi:hypothetical protein